MIDLAKELRMRTDAGILSAPPKLKSLFKMRWPKTNQPSRSSARSSSPSLPPSWCYESEKCHGRLDGKRGRARKSAYWSNAFSDSTAIRPTRRIRPPNSSSSGLNSSPPNGRATLCSRSRHQSAALIFALSILLTRMATRLLFALVCVG
jgi:hypothetical protein